MHYLKWKWDLTGLIVLVQAKRGSEVTWGSNRNWSVWHQAACHVIPGIPEQTLTVGLGSAYTQKHIGSNFTSVTPLFVFALGSSLPHVVFMNYSNASSSLVTRRKQHDMGSSLQLGYSSDISVSDLHRFCSDRTETWVLLAKTKQVKLVFPHLPKMKHKRTWMIHALLELSTL